MTGSPQDAAAKELADLQRALASVYKVERPLVRRGATIIYQAAELNPPRPIALRIFPPDLGLAPFAARFKEAAQLAVRLNHPNVVPIYRMGTRASVPYFLAMKLVEGRSLSHVVAAQGALQVPILLAVLRAVAAALAYAEGRGAAHGALTTETILVDRNGAVAVTEFGTARVVEDAHAATAGRTRFWTPEETSGGAPGVAGDQYALGLVALEMLTGSPQADVDPLAADPLATLKDVRTARVAIPEPLVKVVQTVLAADPTQRYPGAADLLAAIEAIPFSDADGREATVTLGRLARGEPVPKLKPLSPRTAAVPRVSGSALAPREPAPEPPTVEVEPPAPVLELQEPPVERHAPAPPPPPPPPPPEPPRARPVSAPEMPAPALPPEEPPEPASAPRPTAPRTSFAARTSAPAPAPAESGPRRRSPVLTALVLVVAFAAVAAGSFWLGRKSMETRVAQAPPPAAAPAPKPAVPESAKADTTHPAAAVAAADTAHPAPARADTAKPAPRTGVLLINATPETSVFFVDGKQMGRRGVLAATLPAGRRHVEIMAPGFQGFDTVIVVPAGDTLDLGAIPLDSSGASSPTPKDSGQR